jgi:hypothetical protein
MGRCGEETVCDIIIKYQLIEASGSMHDMHNMVDSFSLCSMNWEQ